MLRRIRRKFFVMASAKAGILIYVMFVVNIYGDIILIFNTLFYCTVVFKRKCDSSY
jgi:hypothetical protein